VYLSSLYVEWMLKERIRCVGGDEERSCKWRDSRTQNRHLPKRFKERLGDGLIRLGCRLNGRPFTTVTGPVCEKGR